MPADAKGPTPQKVPKPPSPHGGHITKAEFDARKAADLKSIERAVADFAYPLKTVEDLERHVEQLKRPFYFRGARIDAAAFISKLPAKAFPIQSAEHFASVIAPHLQSVESFAKPKAGLPTSSRPHR